MREARKRVGPKRERIRPIVERLKAEHADAAIAAIHDGDFRPTPSEFACAGCPALDVVCAGPGLLSAPAA